MATEGSTKAVVAALLANAGLAVLKFVAWLLTGASSMLAESIHSVADSGNQGLLLLGGKKAKRAATEEHPFGYGRERYIYAFVVSIVLFSLGGLFALYEAYHKWHEVHEGHPNALLESRWWWVPIGVLVGGIVMEFFSLRTAVIESDKVRGESGWWTFVRQAKSPELPVILLEDLGALVGLFLALVGVGLSLLTGNAYWDVAGTAAIGILLVLIATVLAVETKSLLLGESAARGSIRRIREALQADGSIERIIHMKTLHLGPDELLVAAKVGVRPTESAVEVAAAVNAAEERIRAAVPIARSIYLEADIYRADPLVDARSDGGSGPGIEPPGSPGH